MKHCNKCNNEFPATTEYFYKHTKGKFGLFSVCKKCKIRISCSIENREKRREYYFKTKNEPERIQKKKAARQKYYKEHRHKIIKRNKQKRKSGVYSYNKQKRRERESEYRKNPTRKLHHAMSASIWDALKRRKAGKSWTKLLPYSRQSLIEHLEGLFTPGMTWENYGDWHIDHIKPKSHFSFSSPEDIEFQQCWSLENLQPMWAKENMRKGNRV